MPRPTHYHAHGMGTSFDCFLQETRKHLNNKAPKPKRTTDVKAVTCRKCLDQLSRIISGKRT